MALDDSALLEMIEMLRTADGGDLMRRLLGGMLQAVVDAEATSHIGAQLHERRTHWDASRPTCPRPALYARPVGFRARYVPDPQQIRPRQTRLDLSKNPVNQGE
ncbi:MAG: hypothetical protein NVS3B26_08090 [Mycobacteriales bacterium]